MALQGKSVHSSCTDEPGWISAALQSQPTIVMTSRKARPMRPGPLRPWRNQPDRSVSRTQNRNETDMHDVHFRCIVDGTICAVSLVWLALYSPSPSSSALQFLTWHSFVEGQAAQKALKMRVAFHSIRRGVVGAAAAAVEGLQAVASECRFSTAQQQQQQLHWQTKVQMYHFIKMVLWVT